MRIRLVASILTLALIIAGGGLWLAAHLWPERLCDPRLDLRVYEQRDARSAGYLLRAPDEKALRGAVYDLVQGRVQFFERETGAGLIRYRLGDIRSRHCLRREMVDELLSDLPLPTGQCVLKQAALEAASHYLVEMERRSGGGLVRSRILDLRDDALLAEHRHAPLIPAALRGLACARVRSGSHRGVAAVTGLVFKDRWGQFLSTDEIMGATGDELPPVSEVRARLAQEGRLDRRECHLPGWTGDTEVHEIDLPGGPLEVSARLGAQSSTAGVVMLDVHTPDKAVVIIAKARRPTIWHVHESGASSVVAFIVHGDSGQAVLGLTPYSRILLSTREHNPATNCSVAELKRIERELIAQHGRPRRHQQEIREGKAAVRYSIGEPMKDGSLQFHYTSQLSDYEVSEQ